MEPTTQPAETPTPDATPHRTPWGALAFCALLVIIGFVFLGLAVRKQFFPPEEQFKPMEQYDIASEAQKLVRKDKPAPLSGPLEKIVEEGQRLHFDSYEHPLVGKPAPDFTRDDADGKPWSLKEHMKKGPVVVVFYLGYYCNHCVAQLFDVNEDVERFRELGAEVVALSPDPRETTLKRYKEYGPFKYPVLSDRGSKVAETYGVYKPAHDGKTEDVLHGTFVIDQQGIVRWAAFGETPFGHNPTLLYELAKIKGLAK
jgi:peroxiredoxin Q/BCP